MKLRNGRVLVQADVQFVDGMIQFKFPYAKSLITEVKSMAGARWNPEGKFWRVKDCKRNRFQLDYLQGNNPYEPYDGKLPEIENFLRPVYSHQKEMVAHGLTRRQCIIAGEMGTGKTLASIEIMERSGVSDWWYVGPRNALYAVQADFRKWGAKVQPKFMTYERMTRLIKDWVSGTPAPQGIIFDECSRLKTPQSQRTQAALALSEGMRKDHDNPYIILMSGSPAPKAPTDWWSICEIACPGFLKEGDWHKFQRRLAIVVERESLTGGVFPHVVSWKTSDQLCENCGKHKDDPEHGDMELTMGTGHIFVPAANEVERLYKRMSGLVLVKLKKHCLRELPDKQYQIIRCQPSRAILNAAKILSRKNESAVKTLTLLRELSDGFQYQEVASGTKQCEGCFGTGRDHTGGSCQGCSGKGEVTAYERVAKQISCPKQDAVIELLDSHADVGRIVLYGGFTGSVDRLLSICDSHGWDTIRVDGRGWASKFGTPEQAITAFQSDNDERIAFIGQPGAAGLGLTLTKSPTICYYSNDFNAESRIQSEDRIHRIGMDVNRGATIIDLFHLPSDEFVYNNLKKKRDIQSMTMGELREWLEKASDEDRILE